MAHIRDDLTTGRRLYVQTAYGEPAVAALKSLGAHWDAEQKAWWISPKKRAEVEEILVGADRKEDEAKERGDPIPKEDADDIRLVGKATYKGRTYYVRAVTRDGHRCRLVTLDQSLDFWAPLTGEGDLATITKRYEPREERSYGRPTGRYTHTTLGSIRSFIERQKRAEAQGLPACAECGKRSADLVEDLEDGAWKCYSCCDIPR